MSTKQRARGRAKAMGRRNIMIAEMALRGFEACVHLDRSMKAASDGKALWALSGKNIELYSQIFVIPPVRDQALWDRVSTPELRIFHNLLGRDQQGLKGSQPRIRFRRYSLRDDALQETSRTFRVTRNIMSTASTTISLSNNCWKAPPP